MQYQKTEIRQKIIDAAKKEFFTVGFNNAKISDIAVNAGVPIGNLYRYFEGKDHLFENVIGDSYTAIPDIINKWTCDNTLNNKSQEEILESLANSLIDLFDNYGDELIILVDKSQGSNYQDFSEILNQLIFKYVKESIFKSNVDDFFCMIISNTLLHTALDIFRKGEKDNYKDLIKKMLSFGFSAIDA